MYDPEAWKTKIADEAWRNGKADALNRRGEDVKQREFNEPVTEETIAKKRREKLAFDAAQRERDEQIRKKEERTKAVAKAILDSGSELGGPHMLETMRGLLGEM